VLAGKGPVLEGRRFVPAFRSVLGCVGVRAGGAAPHPKNEGQYGSACQTMPAQSLSCPRPSQAFRSPSTAHLINGAAQPNERLRQTRFDRLLVVAQVFGDLLQREPGEAVKEEDVAAVSRQVTDRLDENPALAVFGGFPKTPPQP